MNYLNTPLNNLSTTDILLFTEIFLEPHLLQHSRLYPPGIMASLRGAKTLEKCQSLQVTFIGNGLIIIKLLNINRLKFIA